MRNICLILSLYFGLSFALSGQDDLHQLAVIARSSLDSVQLRWAPSSPLLWRHLREHGVNVLRYTVMRDGELLSAAERAQGRQLNDTILKPAPVAAFEQAGAADKYVAIGGQAIHGESFWLEEIEGEVSFINAAKDLENRFGFGLFAADHSWSAATLLALGFTDRDVDERETYVYRLALATPFARLDSLKSGYVSIEVSNNLPPPKVSELEYEFGDKEAAIKWRYNVLRSYYTSYNIERSADGLTWEQVNKSPFVPFTEPGRAEVALYQAPFPENNRPYFFRVLGTTPFGDQGPPSDPIQGMGLDPLPESAPSISSVFPASEGGFDINWTFDSDFPINGFRVFRSSSDESEHEDISGLLPASTRTFRDQNPLRSNFYEVHVYDQYDRELSSYSAFIEPDDTTPPKTPEGLRGLIMEDGQVIINWDRNEEPDLLGYRIWLANDPEAEYSLATGTPITRNFFVDKTTLATLSRELYVKITALDYRHNPSPFSDYVVLMRPDTIPPSAPLLINMEATNTELEIHYRPSQASDLRQHELYRRPAGDSTWQLLVTYDQQELPTEWTYLETDLPPGKPYEYRLDAVDWSDLRASSQVLSGQVVDNFIRSAVGKINSTTDRREKTILLAWSYVPNNEQFSHFEIYRGSPGKGPARIISHVSVEDVLEESGRKGQRRFQFLDRGPLRMNTTYQYQLRAVYKDGGQSPLSEKTTIDY